MAVYYQKFLGASLVPDRNITSCSDCSTPVSSRPGQVQFPDQQHGTWTVGAKYPSARHWCTSFVHSCLLSVLSTRAIRSTGKYSFSAKIWVKSFPIKLFTESTGYHQLVTCNVGRLGNATLQSSAFRVLEGAEELVPLYFNTTCLYICFKRKWLIMDHQCAFHLCACILL